MLVDGRFDPDSNDGERIAVADAYLQALLSHDGAAVRFHPRAVRFEAGIKTGFSGRQLTRSLEKGWQFRLIRAVRSKEWTVDEERVVVKYDLDAQFLKLTFAVHVHEVFWIPRDDLRIFRIDVRFARSR